MLADWPVCYYFLGLATEKDLLKHLEKLKQQDLAKQTP